MKVFSFERASSKKECGGSGKKDTPVPMPNTEVKLLRAESSWWETACEDRALPRESKSQTEVWLFFCFVWGGEADVRFLLNWRLFFNNQPQN